jgi:tRNA(Ile)-lysidine synthase
MAARQVRHEFLARVAAKHKIHCIALAHHADDQVELFFLRLLRGSGVEGLTGMKWRSRSPSNARIELVRPLLDVPKADLYACAREQKLIIREDATNTSTDFLRNRIRNDLLPMLRKKYQPSLSATVSRVMEILASEHDFLAASAAEWLEKRKPPFDILPLPLQRRCLHEQLVNLRIAPTFELIEKLRRKPKSPVSIPVQGQEAASSILRDHDGIVEFQNPTRQGFEDEVQMIELDTAKGGQAIFAERKLKWKLGGVGSGGVPKSRKGCEFFDADCVASPIFLRHWRPGDRFQPIGMSSASKLQDLFVNQKVPRDLRRNLIVATTAKGEIFWVQNLRISERFKLTKQTRRRLQWSWDAA